MVGLGGELQTQIQRHVGRKHGFFKNCESSHGPWGRITNGRHRGLSSVPEGRTWKPFHITAHSQKGDHIRVPVRVSGEVVWPKVTPVLANPYPIQEALRWKVRHQRASHHPEQGQMQGVEKAGGGPAGTDMGGKEAAQEVPMVEKAKPR